jgi:hypothetical protein
MTDADSFPTDIADYDVTRELHAALQRALRGDSGAIHTHLLALERDITVEGTKTKLNCIATFSR